MDNRLLVTKCITLLYLESKRKSDLERSTSLVREALETIKLPEVSLVVDQSRDVLLNLKTTALSMCNDTLDIEYTASDILQRIKVNCLDDVSLYSAFEKGILDTYDEDVLNKTIVNTRRFILGTQNHIGVVEAISKAHSDLKFKSDTIQDTRAYIDTLREKLTNYINSGSSTAVSIPGKDVDLANIEDIEVVCEQLVREESGENVYKLGWQGLNRMLQGGLRKGDCIVTSGLQHCYKTSSRLSILKQLVTYNEPKLINPTKRPLIYSISYEDELKKNLHFLYMNMFQHEYGELPDLKKVKPGEVASYIKKKLYINGWEVKFKWINPSNTTVSDIQAMIINLENQGYEIVMCQEDQCALKNTRGCKQGATGDDIRDMWEQTRNFFKDRGTIYYSPHQMSTQAKDLKRDGVVDFVKKVANGGYYAKSKQIDQVVDIELYFDIAKSDDVSYLEIQRGKHRIASVIPEKSKYLVLPFTKDGCVLDDINGPDTSRSRVGGDVIGTPGEYPFWSDVDKF